MVDLPENSDVEVVWTFESRPLVLDLRRLVTSSGLRSVLCINGAEKGDSGSYSVTAISPNKTETKQFNLSVA